NPVIPMKASRKIEEGDCKQSGPTTELSLETNGIFSTRPWMICVLQIPFHSFPPPGKFVQCTWIVQAKTMSPLNESEKPCTSRYNSLKSSDGRRSEYFGGHTRVLHSMLSVPFKRPSTLVRSSYIVLVYPTNENEITLSDTLRHLYNRVNLLTVIKFSRFLDQLLISDTVNINVFLYILLRIKSNAFLDIEGEGFQL
ncbi:hypothetical protein L9F63_020674, partial [Diploptera punctata]